MRLEPWRECPGSLRELPSEAYRNAERTQCPECRKIVPVWGAIRADRWEVGAHWVKARQERPQKAPEKLQNGSQSLF